MELTKAAEGGYSRVYVIAPQKKGEEEEKILKRLIKCVNQTGLGSSRELAAQVCLGKSFAICSLEKIKFEIKSKRCLSPINNKHLTDDNMHFVFEKAQTTLRDFLFDNRKKIGQKGYYDLVKRFMVQVLLGVEHIHKAGYLHRDMKPENILIFKHEKEFNAKVADLGMTEPYCRYPNHNIEIFGSWYRPPEICFRDRMYGQACDMWAVGLMLGEMVSGKNIMSEVEDDDNEVIRAYLSYLPELINEKEDLDKIKEKGEKTLTGLKGGKERPDFLTYLGLDAKRLGIFKEEAGDVKSFVQLLRSILRIDPASRLTATQALNHPFFEEYTDFIADYRTAKIEHKKIKVISCFERREAGKLALSLYQDRKYYNWYTHRILFLSMAMFDKALEWKMKTVKPSAIESEERGRLWSGKECKLYYLFCLYMAYKFYFIDGGAITLKNMAKKFDVDIEEKELSLFLTFEKDFTRKLKYNIYIKTPFEHYCNNYQVQEDKIEKLLQSYLSCQDGMVDLDKVVKNVV